MTDGQPSRARLGIYGGTFQPPHKAHVYVAQAFLRSFSLDLLLVMPTAIPPHKRLCDGDDPTLRLAMAHAAFDGLDPRIQVSDYEIRRAGVSYTCETLTHFAENTDADLYFLCGTDMFLTLPTWRRPEIIFRTATVVCALREEDAAQAAAVRRAAETYRLRYGARTELLPSRAMPMASSDIRCMVQEEKDISSLVPESVMRIVQQHKLYRDGE